MTMDRAHPFVDAGADGIFVPGLLDPRVVGELAESLSMPLNVMATGNALDVETLTRLGVRRISIGAGFAQVVLSGPVQAGRAILTQGRFDTLSQGMPFGEADALFLTGRRSAATTGN